MSQRLRLGRTSPSRRSLGSVVIALALLACGGDSPAPDAGRPDAPPCTPPAEVPKLDLLFVIENSSIDFEQLRILLHAIADFTLLGDSEGNLPDLHVGVVTANLGGNDAVNACAGDGDGGRLQGIARLPGCTPPTEPFLRYEVSSDGSRLTNFSGSLADAFLCISHVGTGGCGFEQPLESLRKALDGSVPENAGFRRPDAFLGVVFWLEEDDCSATDYRLYTGDPAEFGPYGLRCVLHDIRCGDPPEPVPATPGVYEPCFPSEEPGYLFPISRYEELLRTVQPDASRVALAGWVFPRNPLRLAEESDGDIYVSDPCYDSGNSALGPSIRIQGLFDRFFYTSTLTQCGPYPDPSVVGELVSSIRRMLYCE